MEFLYTVETVDFPASHVSLGWDVSNRPYILGKDSQYSNS